MYFIVGSGPAGIACAQALIASGKEVTILDSGLQLEDQRQKAVQDLMDTDPSQWSKERTAFLREGISGGRSGIPLKLAYGSDYAYRQAPGATSIVCDGPETMASYAQGGLSTVWGSAVLPCRDEDIGDWPISVKDLEPGYREVDFPLSAQDDPLSGLFPLYRDDYAALPLSRQAAGLLANLERNRGALNERGVHFGVSRLAVRAAENGEERPGCAACGLCMYGCPRSLIYSSDQTLHSLLAAGKLRYVAGVTVRTVEEKGKGVVIHAIDAAGDGVAFNGERVFIGAGVLNTTAILIRSLGAYGKPFQIADSQYFLLPLLRLRGTRGVTREPLHTLAQLFLEILDEAISPYTIHLQAYTYNELFRDPVVKALGPFAGLLPLDAILGRLILFQGYLHSAHSSRIEAVLERSGQGDTLRLKTIANPEVRQRTRKLVVKLSMLIRRTQLIPLVPFLQLGKPGRGFHSAGSFPMSAAPVFGQSDTLGRPYGMKYVHAVDSTVLPTAPATAITYTVMANAYRIGRLVSQQETE